VDEVEEDGVGEEGCLCDLPDMGGGAGEAMGNPQGNPRIVKSRGVNEMR
jgi:hypothetical protein